MKNENLPNLAEISRACEPCFGIVTAHGDYEAPRSAKRKNPFSASTPQSARCCARAPGTQRAARPCPTQAALLLKKTRDFVQLVNVS